MINDKNLKKIEDLKISLSENKVVVFLGAGCSMAACENAYGWRQLLQSGLEYCESYGKPEPNSKTIKLLKNLLDSDGDIDLWLSVATFIERKLCSSNLIDWRNWLEETVGRFKVSNTEFVNCIQKLNAPLITTNYDTLLFQSDSGVARYTWREADHWARRMGNGKSILHLHGVYEHPKSVILGVSSYDKILGDQACQCILKALGQFNSFLFIGFGSGLEDPNLSSLINWLSAFSGSSHYQLVRSEKTNMDTDKILNRIVFDSYEEQLEILVELSGELGKNRQQATFNYNERLRSRKET